MWPFWNSRQRLDLVIHFISKVAPVWLVNSSQTLPVWLENDMNTILAWNLYVTIPRYLPSLAFWSPDSVHCLLFYAQSRSWVRSFLLRCIWATPLLFRPSMLHWPPSEDSRSRPMTMNAIAQHMHTNSVQLLPKAHHLCLSSSMVKTVILISSRSAWEMGKSSPRVFPGRIN